MWSQTHLAPTILFLVLRPYASATTKEKVQQPLAPQEESDLDLSTFSGWCRNGDNGRDQIKSVTTTNALNCKYECIDTRSCVAFSYGTEQTANCNLYQGGPYIKGNGRSGTTCYIMPDGRQYFLKVSDGDCSDAELITTRAGCEKAAKELGALGFTDSDVHPYDFVTSQKPKGCYKNSGTDTVYWNWPSVNGADNGWQWPYYKRLCKIISNAGTSITFFKVEGKSDEAYKEGDDICTILLSGYTLRKFDMDRFKEIGLNDNERCKNDKAKSIRICNGNQGTAIWVFDDPDFSTRDDWARIEVLTSFTGCRRINSFESGYSWVYNNDHGNLGKDVKITYYPKNGLNARVSSMTYLQF